MHVREANVADVELLFEIRCAVIQNRLSREELEQIGVSTQSLTEMIVSGDYLTVVIEETERAVAFGMARISEGYVFAVFVRPEVEGRGIGRTVLNTLEKGLRAKDIRHAWLCTGHDKSLRAHGFYCHLGWRAVGCTPDGQIRYEKKL